MRSMYFKSKSVEKTWFSKRENVILSYLLVVICYIFLMTLGYNHGFNIINVVIFSVSTALIYRGLYDITKNGLRISNVFLICFFLRYPLTILI